MNYYFVQLTLSVKDTTGTRRAQPGEFDIVLDGTGIKQTRPEGGYGEYLGNGIWIWYKVMGMVTTERIGPGSYIVKATWLTDNSRYAQKSFTLV